MHETPSGLTFSIRVQPRAKRNMITGELGGALKIALTSPPIDGRANEACIEFLADVLDLPRSSIAIISGHRGRNKIVRVTGMSLDAMRQRLRHDKEFPTRD